MNQKCDKSINIDLSLINSPQSSRHSLDHSLFSARSDSPGSDVSSLEKDYQDENIRNDQNKSTQPIIECQSNNKLSFGISRLLSSKESDAKCIDHQTSFVSCVRSNHHRVQVNESDNLEIENLKVENILNKCEKTNDSILRVPAYQYNSSSFNYSNPFSWLNPNLSTFISKDRLSVSLPIDSEIPSFGHRRIGHPYQNRTPPKRKKPRTSFTRGQINELEKRFHKQKYLASSERVTLAKHLKMTDAQVKTWFQNRRTKWRRQTAEEQEAELQTANRLMISMQNEASKDCIHNGKLFSDFQNNPNEPILTHPGVYGSFGTKNGYCSNPGSIYPYSNLHSWISSSGRNLHRQPIQGLNGEPHVYVSPLTLTSMLC